MMRSGAYDDRQEESKQSWRKCSERHNTLRRDLSTEGICARIDADWNEAAERRDFSKLDEIRDLTGRLTEANYTETLSTLLKIEEAHDAINQRRYDMFEQGLRLKYRKDKDGKQTDYLESVGIHVEGLSQNGQPKLVKNDTVILRNRKKAYKLTSIESIINDLIMLPVVSFRKEEEFLDDRLDIFFVSCSLYRYYEKALERFHEDETIRRRLFEDQSIHATLQEPNSGRLLTSCGTLESEERFGVLNEHQQKAVLSILEAKCWPKPYILFGPPGTGKTHTLAEAIGQIYVRKPEAKILYCANSNTCVDQMVEKLQKIPIIGEDDIVRLFAGERPVGIGMSRIILTTNMKSSTLMDEFRFDYVIIDEAGHAHEAESLLPICCLKPTGCLVLAGDPKQLGPVVQCSEAEKYGLARSLLERIFDFHIYQRDKATGKYNSDYITKLLTSYRCDPRVLAISNELFYDGELECANETPKSLLQMMRITNPLQLCFVRGSEETPRFSTSRINGMEADNCVDLIMRLYKMGVTPDQIGVISPYKLQSKIIRKKLDEKLDSTRDFFEKRFQDRELVKQVKERAEAKSCDSDTELIIFDIEKLKLGIEEKSDPDEQNEEVKELEAAEKKAVVEYELVEVVKKRSDRWLCKIDSVDAYQGNEREIIIISTVRTPMSGRTDFIDEPRRFNVALSRAKWLVFVLGHKRVLEDLSNWGEFVSRAGEEAMKWPKQSTFDSQYPYEQFKPLFKL